MIARPATSRSREHAHRSERPVSVDDMIIREATSGDAYAIARVHVRSWQAAYAGLMPQTVLDGLSVDDRAAAWTRIIADAGSASRVVVAQRDGEIVAWASFGPAREEDLPGAGELYGIYADPDSWSTGAGHALLASVEESLRAAGHRGAYLWVLEGNDRAAHFYERHGWIADGEIKLDERGAMTLRELRRVKAFGRT